MTAEQGAISAGLPRRRLRILVLNSIFFAGGAERVTHDLIRHLGTTDYECVFCALYEAGPMGEEFAKSGYVVYQHIMRSKYDLRCLLQLKAIVERHGIDVIYLMTQPVTLLWGVVFSKLCRIPVVALISNTIVIKENQKFRIYRWLLPMVSRVLTVSQLQKERLVQEVGIEPNLVKVVCNGIDSRRFTTRDKCEAKRLVGFDPKTKHVGLVARLVKLKAVDVFLQAARLVTANRVDVQFAIVGDGPESAALQSLARSLTVDKCVRFVGFVQEPAPLIEAFDIGVLCSRTEALPIAVLEYMTAGLPCIVTNVGGLTELVTDGVNGSLVAADDPEALAARILELLDDPETALRMGRAGRAMALQHFTMEAMATSTAQVFREVVGA